MSRNGLSSDYPEIMSDATTCSCIASPIEKSCAPRGMFQEPFFLHPPGSRPRDGLYINPMGAGFGPVGPRSKDTSPSSSSGTESFFLHSPHDLVYTRITSLFEQQQQQQQQLRDSSPAPTAGRSSVEQPSDDTLTVKVDVHMSNGTYKPVGNGSASSLRSEPAKDSGSEHAYEQICIKPQEQPPQPSPPPPPPPAPNASQPDNASPASRSRKTDRRYSRSSSASESSNMSSEVHCYSSTTSTPSLSRNSSNERTSKSPKVPENSAERKTSTTSSTRAESEKEAKTAITGPSIFRPPPPPPPPPPEVEEVVIVTSKVVENSIKEEKTDGIHSTTQEQRAEATITTISAGAAEAAGPCVEQPLVGGSGPPSEDEQQQQQQHHHQQRTASSQVSAHLVNRHMVLPFIPPKFLCHDSDTLLKPSEYLRSICNANVARDSGAPSLSKARSVDNLDIQGRGSEEDVDKSEAEEEQAGEGGSGPPPPPLPPPAPSNTCTANIASTSPSTEPDAISKQSQQQQQQPLATISIQDLTSVQLRRTNVKMHATKTFSAPPNRSVSMTNVSEAFFVQKTDLIAELKKTKDIPGIKKLKVQRAQVEKSQEQTLITEITKAFSIENFVDQIPEKDSSGNVIPIWKRQMLARKAAERAKKELEEQIARENEEKRQKAIPPWKRQLLAKKDSQNIEIKSTGPSESPLIVPPTFAPGKIEVPIIIPILKKDSSEIPVAPPAAVPVPASPSRPAEEIKPTVVQLEEKKTNGSTDDSDDARIIPWRAQLRKTNSKLNILD